MIGVGGPEILPQASLTESPFDVWPPERNFNPPPGGEWFQRELTRIAGLTPNGLPMLRLEWGSICTWTPYTKTLKYLQRRVLEEQVGWYMDVKGKDGKVIKTLSFPLKKEFGKLKAILPDGDEYGLPYPRMEYNQEIGVPRWWVSQYTPPEIIGPWEEVRQRVKRTLGHPGQEADMGPMPREGFYFLGWHCIARIVPHICCARAKREHRQCFHLYREPSELDLEYVRALWSRNYADTHDYDWRSAPSAEAMQKNLMRIADSKKELARKEREEMKLRIRDTFNTHKQRFTSRKGKSTFIFSSAGGDRKVY